MHILSVFVVRTIDLCTRHAWKVIAAMILLALASGYYAATHFAMTTDINKLISQDIPWRQREAAFENAFPQFDLIVAVVDAPTPELSHAATKLLVDRLSQRPELFRTVTQPGGGEFFARNGLLFEPPEVLGAQMKRLTDAQRLLQVLASDPSLHGVVRALQLALLGVQGGRLKLDAMTWPLTLSADAFDKINAKQPASFSWRVLMQGKPGEGRELRNDSMI
jgi:hypothetical protein